MLFLNKLIVVFGVIKVADLTVKLDASHKEVEKQLVLAKALEARVIASLGDNKWMPYLVKVFKKKMKRKKKKEGQGYLLFRLNNINYCFVLTHIMALSLYL